MIYQEGDEERRLGVYIENGFLRFEGCNKPEVESGWQGSVIETERIRPLRWHHAVLVLDGRADVRNDALCAYLDGKLIDTRPGSQLWGSAASLNIAGLVFAPSATPFSNVTVDDSENSVIRKDPSNYLRGQIMSVRIWESVRTADQIAATKYDLDAASDIFHWGSDATPVHSDLISSDSIHTRGNIRPLSPVLPLMELADIKSFLTKFKLDVDKLTTLWANIKHTGKGDNHYCLIKHLINRALPEKTTGRIILVFRESLPEYKQQCGP